MLWDLAERGERIEYIRNTMHDLWEAAVTPTGEVISLGIAVIWLTGVVNWPDIKAWLYSISGHQLVEKPKSIPDRLATAELRLQTLQGQMPQVESLEQRVKKTADLLSALPNYQGEVDRIKQLEHDARDIISALVLIKELHPESLAASLPFQAYKLSVRHSSPWSQEDIESVMWAKSLKRYTDDCRSCFQNWHPDDLPILQGQLFVYVESWEQNQINEGYVGCLTLLNQHVGELVKCRVAHAGRFMERFSVKATIS